jgi:perosamine synthetase
MPERLAIDGGTPVRDAMLPYGRQEIDEDDIRAVAEVLRSDFLTTGPEIARFEEAFAGATGAEHAVAVSSGTAALHAALATLDLAPGDEVVVPALTFAASAAAVVMNGARPVFADVDPRTLLLTAETLRPVLTPRTKAIVAVDYAGQPCDYEALRRATGGELPVVADACHALGATCRGRPVGTLADLSAFSLHPVKHVTSGEGGAITTDDAEAAARMRRFRNHGISADHRQRAREGSWYYEVGSLGYNYRLTDFQAALGRSQLRRLPEWLERRRALAADYRAALQDVDGFEPLESGADVAHAYHLFVIEVDDAVIEGGRDRVFAALRAEGIGVNVHYVPVHLHPFYRRVYGTAEGLAPVAERAYRRILTLPLFPAMSDGDIGDVLTAIRKVALALAPGRRNR